MTAARKRIARPMESIADVAARYRISDDTIRRRIADGTLPAYRVGKVIRIYVDDADVAFSSSRS